MYNPAQQLHMFGAQTFDPTYIMKREMRVAISQSHLSREQIVDKMNGTASSEGLGKTVTKATLDGWCKDSDPGRMPSSAWLVVFCKVMETVGPIRALLLPLGCDVAGPEDAALLAWARADMERRRAVRRARVALDAVE